MFKKQISFYPIFVFLLCFLFVFVPSISYSYVKLIVPCYKGLSLFSLLMFFIYYNQSKPILIYNTNITEKYILLFCINCFISSFYALSFQSSIQLSTKFFLIILGYLFIKTQIMNLKKDYVLKIEKWIYFGFYLSIVIISIQYISGNKIFTVIDKFVHNDYSSIPIYVRMIKGATMLTFMTVPIIVGLVYKKLHGIAIITWIYCLFLTFKIDSLANQLAFILASFLAVIIFFLNNKIIRLILYSSIFSILALPLIFFFLNPYIFDNYLSHSGLSILHRLYMYKFLAMKIFSDKFLFGYGVNSLKYIVINPTDFEHLPNEFLISYFTENHSNILQIWFELGLFGIILTMLSILYLFKNILNENDIIMRIGFTSIFIIYMTIGAFSWGIFHSWWVIETIIPIFALKIINQSRIFASEDIFKNNKNSIFNYVLELAPCTRIYNFLFTTKYR